ncbi:FAD-dependent oxidoreductase [Carnobacterium maltaromaticum]|uniref:FAD-dependent oxidoreductase n=1 Tax=Carnobacterium maltaromaticum TaxID=2751 RepID=UPI000704B1F7|nr:FAD-dependent oxidoreductase [Carnobacterium maltaromaticum]KRN74287.1 assimilatory nitrite reductase subunit [Carnobacterium maltaromaticum]MBC9809522.1 SidA/IucD/PvdA family monooxygenase [Carnobacterium maltaromaticum]CRH18278.1 Pyridine nucleotide-disulphide oxidoreductase family protein [Carnobacterium maltaromaticum]
MKIVIIGSVAAGTSVAAKARRNTEDAEICVYDQDKDISYSICGIPYYIGEEVEDLDKLTPRNAAWFKKRYNVDIFTEHRVTAINTEKQTLEIQNLQTGEIFIDSYDELVLATGAKPIVPEVFLNQQSKQNIFHVRNIQDARSIHEFIQNGKINTATIIGAGFIGLEMAEQLAHKGIEVTLIQRGQQIMKQMDSDMAFRAQKELETNNVNVLLNTTITKVIGKEEFITELVTNQGKTIKSDLVILAAGVEPNTSLTQATKIKLGTSGAIAVTKKMETSVPHIYAVGDVAESFSVITKKPIYRPLGSTANKMGRIAGDVITGGTLEHRGILGTGIVRAFDLTIAYTGLSEKEALAEGIDVAILYNIKPDHADYLGGKELTIKALADKSTGKILGAQIIGRQGVDKRIDVLATAISFGAVAEDLFHLDLAYAPPFATTKDPILYTGMALDNAVKKGTPLMTPNELMKRQVIGEKLQIIDTRSKKQYEKSSVEGAIHIPLTELRKRQSELDKDLVTITYCNKGVSGNAAQNILINKGFKEVYNLSGGNKNYQVIVEMENHND